MDKRLISGQFMGVVAALGVVVALLFGACLASAQTTDQRLTEVAKDLFSPAASVDSDIAQLKAVLAADPKSAQAHMLLGLAYRTKGSSDLMGEAVAELRQAIDLDPSLVPARVYLAHLYLDLGRPERGRDELLSALTQLPGQPQLQALLAECQRQLGKPDAALELTDQALKADPSMAEARYYQGLALNDLKRRDDAIQAFEQAIKDGGRRPEVYGSLGTALLDAGRVDEAIVSLTEAVKLDSTRPEPMLPLARAYRLKGQLARADAALKTVRSLVGTSALSGADQQIQRDLSFEEGLLRLRQTQLEPAALALRKAIDLDPTYGPAYRYLAEVYLRQHLYSRAQDQAARAEKLGSPLPEDLQKALRDRTPVGPPKKDEPPKEDE